MAVALFGMDACCMTRRWKGAIMSLLVLVWITWSILVAVIPTEGFDDMINFGIRRIALRNILQSCAITVCVFCMKYTWLSFVQKCDIVVLRIAPIRIPLTLPLAAANARNSSSSECKDGQVLPPSPVSADQKVGSSIPPHAPAMRSQLLTDQATWTTSKGFEAKTQPTTKDQQMGLIGEGQQRTATSQSRNIVHPLCEAFVESSKTLPSTYRFV